MLIFMLMPGEEGGRVSPACAMRLPGAGGRGGRLLHALPLPLARARRCRAQPTHHHAPRPTSSMLGAGGHMGAEAGGRRAGAGGDPEPGGAAARLLRSTLLADEALLRSLPSRSAVVIAAASPSRAWGWWVVVPPSGCHHVTGGAATWLPPSASHVPWVLLPQMMAMATPGTSPSKSHALPASPLPPPASPAGAARGAGGDGDPLGQGVDGLLALLREQCSRVQAAAAQQVRAGAETGMRMSVPARLLPATCRWPVGLPPCAEAMPLFSMQHAALCSWSTGTADALPCAVTA